MSEVKDPEIKLFGKTISLSPREAPAPAPHYHREEQQQESSGSASSDNKSASGVELTGSRLEGDPINPTEDESVEPETPSRDSENPKTPDANKETLSPEVSKTDEQSENSGSQEKKLKKPDKILPCPRCNSMDTKFCYYNNYNVNQPRHFCRNCQRYWTAGGTMRNVPVGSGRRKNKSTCASSDLHTTGSEGFYSARADTRNGIHLSPLRADGTVLAFGSERPLCDSMKSALNLAERSQIYIPNGFRGTDLRIPISYGATEIRRDHLNRPSSTSMNLPGNGGHDLPQETVLRSTQGYAPQIPCFPGAPWPSHWCSPTPEHALNPSGFPVAFYPATPYWGYAVPGPQNVPFPSPSPPSTDHSKLSTNPCSPLGKHYRDGSMLRSNSGEAGPVEEIYTERNVVLPKTLKIDDAHGAATSCIRSALGPKSDDKDPWSKTSLFEAFYPKAVGAKNHVADTSLILQANPAAFSRSVNFHEST